MTDFEARNYLSDIFNYYVCTYECPYKEGREECDDCPELSKFNDALKTLTEGKNGKALL